MKKWHLVALTASCVALSGAIASTTSSAQKLPKEVEEEIRKLLEKASRDAERKKSEKTDVEKQFAEEKDKSDEKISEREELKAPDKIETTTDREIQTIFNWIKKSVKEVPDVEYASIEDLIKKLDAPTKKARTEAMQDLILKSKPAARALWRARLNGSIEKRSRIDRLLRLIHQGNPYRSILARAARLSNADLSTALAANEADFELLLNRIAYEEISRFPRLWAQLFVSSKTKAQAALILKQYDAYVKKERIEIFRNISKHYSGTTNPFVLEHFEKVVTKLEHEEMLSLGEASLMTSNIFQKTVFRLIRESINAEQKHKFYQAAKDDKRRLLLLKTLRLKSAEDQKLWASLYSTISKEMRSPYLDMVMRESLELVVAQVISDTPDAPEVPALLTVLGTRAGWERAFFSVSTSSARQRLMRWLPYSSIKLTEQEALLLDFFKTNRPTATRQAAATMLRGFGSQRLVKQLLRDFAIYDQDPMIGGLIAAHAETLSEVVPEMLADKRVKAVYERVGQISKLEILKRTSDEVARPYLLELSYSPILVVKDLAIKEIIRRRTGFAGRMLYALTIFLPDQPARTAESRAISLAPSLLRMKERSDAEIVAMMDVLNGDTDQAAELIEKDPLISILAEQVGADWLEAISFALYLGGSEEAFDSLKRLPKEHKYPLFFRSLVKDEKGQQLVEKLVSDRPLEVLMQAKLYEAVGRHGDVVSALIRMAKQRTLNSLPDQYKAPSFFPSIIKIALHPSQHERLPELLSAINRAAHRPTAIAFLKAFSLVGAPIPILDSMDTTMRRMRVGIVSLEVLRTAMMARDMDQAWIDKTRKLIGKSLGSIGEKMLKSLETLAANQDGSVEQERALLSTAPDAEREASIRALALRGNLAALNACLAQLMQEKERDSTSYLPNISHLFEDFDPALSPVDAFHKWQRSRFLWRFDHDKNIYRLAQGGQ